MNRKQKRGLYETVMRSSRKLLNESVNFDEISSILENEFPLSITTYAGTQDDTYEVTVSEYDEDDTCLCFHAETEVGFYVDFEIPVDDFMEEYEIKPAEEIVEWYLIAAVDDEVDSQYIHGEYDHDDNWDLDESVDGVEQYYYIITLQDGTEIYNSLDDDLSFDTYKDAEYDCDVKLDEIVDNQADDEDAFMIGDYRTKIIQM